MSGVASTSYTKQIHNIVLNHKHEIYVCKDFRSSHIH